MKTNKILILQTAFLGDVILTLPLLNVLKKNFPGSEIDFLCIPETSEILINNSCISEIIPYDKRKSGLYGLFELIVKLKKKNYDLIISPHRSYRSSVISYLSSPLRSIAFDISSLSFLYSDKVEYMKNKHEIIRNLNLLKPIGINVNEIVRPGLFISDNEKRKIDCVFYEHKVKPDEKFIVIAPGSVWFTKR
ncbi:MAG: glycosyltransferase family 9 protein, partial [Ignavibacteria bacterium]|nr:glycosyltransferase family 9 protein [Ignavibacteria bacterium]